MIKRIEEIDKELESLTEEHHKLFEKQEILEREKRSLTCKEVIDGKVLTKTKWELEQYFLYKMSFNAPGPNDEELPDDEFTLKAVSKHELDDLQTQLDLWYHGSFEISEDIRLIGDDGDFLIHANKLEAGIKFIKLAGLEIDRTNCDDEISSLRKKADSIEEFMDKVCKK